MNYVVPPMRPCEYYKWICRHIHFIEDSPNELHSSDIAKILGQSLSDDNSTDVSLPPDRAAYNVA